jgi:anti-anti-sigma factor
LARTEELQIETRREGTAAIVVLEGRISVYSYAKLDAVLAGIFSSGCYHVVIEMGKVKYLTSAGAGVLMNALSVCLDNQGRLILANLSAEVHQVLSVLSMTEVLPIALDLETALAAL